MRAVYLAVDTTLERQVALKAITIKGDDAAAESARARFRRKAKIAAISRHPNVATVHDFLSDDRLDLGFRPTRLNDRPVPVMMELPIAFSPPAPPPHPDGA